MPFLSYIICADVVFRAFACRKETGRGVVTFAWFRCWRYSPIVLITVIFGAGFPTQAYRSFLPNGDRPFHTHLQTPLLRLYPSTSVARIVCARWRYLLCQRIAVVRRILTFRHHYHRTHL